MVKKLASLFSGGKDSVYSIYLSKKEGYEISCLITLVSENKYSYMFHTPSVDKTKKQAKIMKIPLIIKNTSGKKELELEDLEEAIKLAKKKYNIEGIITGAIKSVYQASRIQEICNKLDLECFNPLWQKDELKYLNELIKERFEIIVVGIFAYPLDKSWLLRKIDSKFIKEISELNKKYKINVAGEGGEFESFVLKCPLFSRGLKIINSKKIKEGENSFRVKIDVE